MGFGYWKSDSSTSQVRKLRHLRVCDMTGVTQIIVEESLQFYLLAVLSLPRYTIQSLPWVFS